MVKLLIIADDFTGALDTGIQFAMEGASTKLIIDRDFDFKAAVPDGDVLVIDAESRHLTQEDAFEVVADIVRRGRKAGIPYIYKKTDSGLRGNIGSELKALVKEGDGSLLPFIPAFPKMNRTTKDGIHYMDGVPIAQSVFGRDPFEPVTCSYVPDIIKSQADIQVDVVSQGETFEDMKDKERILVFDCESTGELAAIAGELKAKSKLGIMAGCAGFASVLPELLGLKGPKPALPQFYERFLIVCGSVNEITKAQLTHAELNGFKRFNLTPEQKLSPGYLETQDGRTLLEDLKQLFLNEKKLIIDTNDIGTGMTAKDYAEEKGMDLAAVRTGIAGILGYITKELLAADAETNLLLTGGDTLLGFVKAADCAGIKPIYEMAPGTVLSELIIDGKPLYVISKSGGFGKVELFTDLDDMMRNRFRKEEGTVEYIHVKDSAGSL